MTMNLYATNDSSDKKKCKLCKIMILKKETLGGQLVLVAIVTLVTCILHTKEKLILSSVQFLEVWMQAQLI